MKIRFVIFALVLTAASCSVKKNVADPETLPKDVALKPERQPEESEEVLVQERENIRVMKASIDSLSVARTCSGSADWRVSPVGSKPCGGPAAYIAYHKDVETEILPKIQEFTRRQAAYNRRRNLFSDCRVEPQAAGVRCELGKAVLVYGAQSGDAAVN